jgi:hypothetical protein
MGLGLVVGECALITRELEGMLTEVLVIELSFENHQCRVETDGCGARSMGTPIRPREPG